MKTQILTAIGETELQPAAGLNEALAANDRIKCLFSLLQRAVLCRASVARQLGKVCLVACPKLDIDLDKRQCTIGDAVLNEGDLLSLDGNTGAVHLGCLTPVIERPKRALDAIATWRAAAPTLPLKAGYQ